MLDSYTVPVYFTPLNSALGGYGFSGQTGSMIALDPVFGMQVPSLLDQFKNDEFWEVLVDRRDEAGRRRDSCASL